MRLFFYKDFIKTLSIEKYDYFDRKVSEEEREELEAEYERLLKQRDNN